MNNSTTQQQAQECAMRFLLGEGMVPCTFFDHIKILIPGFLKHVLLKNVQDGCCSEAGPGYQCGHCRNSIHALIISRAIVLSLHEFPSELHATEELNTLCSWVREEVINFNIKSCNEIKSILPDKMSKLILGCTSITTAKPSLNQWGDDIARLLQPISPHWSIRVKLLMHMGYRVTLVDFDDVAIFAQKELKAVCSDASQLVSPTKEGDAIIPQGSNQYNPTVKELPLANQKLSYSELSTELKNAQAIINKKDQLIQKKDQVIQEKNDLLAEQMDMIYQQKFDSQDIIKQKDQIIQEKNNILKEQFAVIERFKSIQIQDSISSSSKGEDDISPPPTAKERPLDKQTKQKLEQLMNESNFESISVSTATAPQQQHSNIMSSRGAAIVPCRARDMPVDHNFKTAYFVIPDGIEHGDELMCSYPACRQAGVKFRYCLQCRVPVAKRNFRKLHHHSVPGEEDEWEDEDSEEETNQDVCRPVNDGDNGSSTGETELTSMPLPTKSSSLDIDEQIQPNESNGSMGSQVDSMLDAVYEPDAIESNSKEAKVTQTEASRPIDIRDSTIIDNRELDDSFVIVIREKGSGGAAGPVKPELTMEDAILYVKQVKLEFKDRPHIYNEFLEIMKDSKAQGKKVDIIEIINRIRRLFHGHNDLILGFNKYLSGGYRIEMRQSLPLHITDSFNEFQKKINSIGKTLPKSNTYKIVQQVGSPEGIAASTRVEQQQTESESQSSTTPGKC